EMLRALRRWQETLGVQHDAHVASMRLQGLAAAPPKSLRPETLFLMGRLAEHYAVAAGKARKRFAKSYRKVRGRWKILAQKSPLLQTAAAPAPARAQPAAPAAPLNEPPPQASSNPSG
ncbi:MAG TPA: hypothetical protein VFB37_13795, partial [Steroidobacteraceae bacterium]|nr:hypothetical protein [Steroidobacteraceae bacterium]